MHPTAVKNKESDYVYCDDNDDDNTFLVFSV